jgi:hypothetical protein
MLIDNRTRAMLTTGLPKKHALSYPCRLFSKNTGDEFLAYLRSIEDEADPFILALVRDTYGKDWFKPYTAMFNT